MTEPQSNSLIEIGDLDEDSTPTPPEPPRVVIEYRDRGVPWMLVPPLVAVAVVVAVVVALAANARLNPKKPAVGIFVQSAAPHDVREAGNEGLVSGSQPIEEPKSSPITVVIAHPSVLENPAVLPEPGIRPEPTVTATLPQPTRVDLDPEAEDVSPVAAEPVTRPPILIGLDPKAFDNPSRNAVPTPTPPVEAQKDSGIAVTGKTIPANGLQESDNAPPNLPDEVDPALLPPSREQSLKGRRDRAIRAALALEGERSRFHTAVAKAISAKRSRAADDIRAIGEDFRRDVPPAAIERAKQLLGKVGPLAGASTGERIALLRKLGFPEPAILGDIFDNHTRYESTGARHALTPDAMYVQAARILLKYPPTRSPSGNSRPTSAAKAVPDP